MAWTGGGATWDLVTVVCLQGGPEAAEGCGGSEGYARLFGVAKGCAGCAEGCGGLWRVVEGCGGLGSLWRLWSVVYGHTPHTAILLSTLGLAVPEQLRSSRSRFRVNARVAALDLGLAISLPLRGSCFALTESPCLRKDRGGVGRAGALTPPPRRIWCCVLCLLPPTPQPRPPCSMAVVPL